MDTSGIVVRAAKRSDLNAINRVIEAAVTGWDLPERVIRLSLPSYRYTSSDLDHMQMYAVEQTGKEIIGVSACEPADEQDAPAGEKALLLHGIYILPQVQHQGLGSQLFDAALRLARDQKLGGLLVKAHTTACGFFQSRGMQKLLNESTANEYEHRYWIKTR